MQNFRSLVPPGRSGPANWSAIFPISTFFTEMALICSFLGIFTRDQRHSTDNFKSNKKCAGQNLPMTSLRGSKLRSKLKKKFDFFFVKFAIFDPKSHKNDFFHFFPWFHEQIDPFTTKNWTGNAKTVISKIRFFARADFSRFRRYLGSWLEFPKYF